MQLSSSHHASRTQDQGHVHTGTHGVFCHQSPPLDVHCCTGSGQVKPRPGVLRLMEQGRAAGLKLAVCSAATKSSVIFVVEQLLGTEAFKVSRGQRFPQPLMALWCVFAW